MNFLSKEKNITDKFLLNILIVDTADCRDYANITKFRLYGYSKMITYV